MERKILPTPLWPEQAVGGEATKSNNLMAFAAAGAGIGAAAYIYQQYAGRKPATRELQPLHTVLSSLPGTNQLTDSRHKLHPEASELHRDFGCSGPQWLQCMNV